MKIGYIFGEKNFIMQPGDSRRIDYSDYPYTRATYSRLYPNDIFAMLSPYKIDFDICRQLDLAIYILGTPPDNTFVEIADKIPCKLAALPVFGYLNFINYTIEGLLQRKKIMDMCDFVIAPTKEGIALMREWTDSPVFYINIPLPISFILEAIAGVSEEIPQYDILVIYGPNKSENIFGRNGHTAVLAAEYIASEVDGFETVGLFSHTKDANQLERLRDYLDRIGCTSIQLIERLPYKQFIRVLSKTKLAIDLDVTFGGGKFVVECAVLRKPVIVSNTIPYARDIYKGIPMSFPLDIESMVDTAKMVAVGRWTDEWLDMAYYRAMRYSLACSAELLSTAVRQTGG